MKGISEKAFQAQVIDLARMLGYLVYFTWRSIHSPAGFPDLVLVRGDGSPGNPGRILFIELKREGARLSPAQEDWARALRNAGGEVYWFDSSASDWELLKKVLDGNGRIV